MVGGRTKLCVVHNGCLNMAYDVNLIEEALRRRGHEVVQNPEDSDEIVIAGCGSRSAWVDEVVDIAKDATKTNRNKNVIITGCVSRIDPGTVRAHLEGYNVTLIDFDELLDSYHLQNLETIDCELSQNENTNFIGRGSLRRLTTKKAEVLDELRKVDREYGTSVSSFYEQTTRGFIFYRESRTMEYITASRGCAYSCSYCAIPKGRGPYRSVPKDLILHKAELALEMGRKRIMLVGDEIGNYGIDIENCNLTGLMDSILALDSDVALGIRFIEPSPFLKYFEGIREHCVNNRVFLLHIPLQSGSQRILRLMNRNYDICEVRDRLLEIRNASDTVLCSNFIVGFPSETISDFQMTLKTIRDLDIHVNTVIPFSDRPDTPASSMDGKVTPNEKLKRCQTAINLLSEMRADRFEGLLRFLPKERRTRIVSLIENAESYSPRL